MVSSSKRDFKYLNCNYNFCKHRNNIYIYLICENYIVYKSLWFIISRCLISSTCHCYFFFGDTFLLHLSPKWLYWISTQGPRILHQRTSCPGETKENSVSTASNLFFFSLGMFTVLALINDSICHHCRELLAYINRWTYL